MSRRIVVHDSVHTAVKEEAEDTDRTMKETLRDIVQEAGYDV